MTPAPISYEDAARFVGLHHRHHRPPQGWKWGIAAMDGDRLCGVVMVGRPVARHADDGTTLEVLRCCTDGTKNACSFLYASAWRAARALGYTRLITYTLPEEGGASLRASGWRELYRTKGDTWNRPGAGRERTEGKTAGTPRTLWEVSVVEEAS
jgi:hypothetical protein